MYLDVSQTAVSSALIRESDEAQKPVYYTIQAFKGVEARYSNIEKMVFALIIASRKLRLCFQAHSIIVLTNQPIKKAMNKLDAAGWLVFWAVELGKFDVKYRPQTTIKAQALANLIANDGCFSSSIDITSWALATAKARSSQKLVANFPLSWPFEDQGGGVSSSIEPTNNEPLDRSTRNFQYLSKVQHKVESIQVYLCSAFEKFLGFMVSQRGLKANPNKVKAIIEMSPLMNVKEVQHMSGRIAALNRFVSRSTNKCFPFLSFLKNLNGRMNVPRLLKVWNSIW